MKSTRGRKKQPLALQAAKGYTSSAAPNFNQPTYDLASAAPPAWLSRPAADCFVYYAKLLISKKILTEIDIHNLVAFSCAYDRWTRAEKEVMNLGITISTPKGDVKKNPACTVVAEAMNQMMKFGAILGLDPSSRNSIVQPKSVEGNPFEDI